MLLSLTIAGGIAGIVAVEIDREALARRAEQAHLDLGSVLDPGQDWKVLESIGSVIAVGRRIEGWLRPRGGVVGGHLLVLAHGGTRRQATEGQ